MLTLGSELGLDLLDLWDIDPWDILCLLFLFHSDVVDTLGAGGLPGDIEASHGGFGGVVDHETKSLVILNLIVELVNKSLIVC